MCTFAILDAANTLLLNRFTVLADTIQLSQGSRSDEDGCFILLGYFGALNLSHLCATNVSGLLRLFLWSSYNSLSFWQIPASFFCWTSCRPLFETLLFDSNRGFTAHNMRSSSLIVAFSGAALAADGFVAFDLQRQVKRVARRSVDARGIDQPIAENAAQSVS